MKMIGFINREFIDIKIDGRIILDMYMYLLKTTSLRSYSLNNVSFQFLGEQKEDVHYSLISKLWQQNEYTRRRLAIYCMKDAYLPLKLMDKFLMIINFSEMCRVTSIPLDFSINRGQQIKISMQIHKNALKRGYIVPNFNKDNEILEEEGFEGAFVLCPDVGFHIDPIVTLDFSSLYPSIMIAHNLCYSTLLKSGEEKSLKENEDYTRTPNGECFVTEKIRKGILPNILEELLSARRSAKKDMNNEKDPFKKQILNGRQLALKVCCNSVYGFTGATSGQLPCLQISSSITAIGRMMIVKTREIIEKKYSQKEGFKYDSKVIYGDTDSVMIKFGVKTLKEALELGVESSEFITKQFKRPIKIEFEKVFWPYLLLKKKRYAGVYWTREDKYDKIDTKGLEVVRRDNCELVRIVMEKILKILLVDRNVDEAVKYCKNIISDLLQNKIDISLLIISKTLSKRGDDYEIEEELELDNEKEKKISKSQKWRSISSAYKSKQPHSELAEKMRKRDPGTAPNVGERIQYVIIKGEKGSKNYNNSEDPIYALEHDLPIDNDYYLEHQLKKPILRIFEYILKDPEKELFSGEHTRIKKSGVNPKSNFVFGSFLIIKKRCLNCKVIINSGVVCQNCKDKMRTIYIENRLEMNNKERMYADLWSQCQRCQGSILQDIICQNRDCPIFYRRYKVKKELKMMKEIMDRFNEKPDW